MNTSSIEKTITIRFWYHNPVSAHILINKLSSYNPKYIEYTGNKYPYKMCNGRVLFILAGSKRNDFDKIISMGMEHAVINEILINNKWVQLKTIIFVK